MQVYMNRRSFIKFISLFGMAASIGAIFSCNSHEKTSAFGSGLIDVHHHILPPDCVATLKRNGMTSVGGVALPDWSPQTALSHMDQNEIATGITSMPYLYLSDISLSRNLMRHCNEFSSRLVSDYPKRFGSFAALPLPDVEAALRELEYALDQLKLDGIVLPTNIGGHYLGDPVFDELFSELNRREAVVFIHPVDPPGGCLTNLKLPTSLIEFVFDTTRAIVNLTYSGTLERCPDIRFIVSHAGGTVPYLSWRISLFQHKAGMQEKVPLGVMTYLKRFYYETALSTAPTALRSLQELVDPEKILFGSDYPFAPKVLTAVTIDGLKSYGGFDKSALKAIKHENALKLFPRIGKG